MDKETDVMDKALEVQRRQKLLARAASLSNFLVTLDTPQEVMKLVELTVAMAIVQFGGQGTNEEIGKQFGDNLAIAVKLVRSITAGPTEGKVN
jgi:hypothetical protein